MDLNQIPWTIQFQQYQLFNPFISLIKKGQSSHIQSELNNSSWFNGRRSFKINGTWQKLYPRLLLHNQRQWKSRDTNGKRKFVMDLMDLMIHELLHIFCSYLKHEIRQSSGRNRNIKVHCIGTWRNFISSLRLFLFKLFFLLFLLFMSDFTFGCLLLTYSYNQLLHIFIMNVGIFIWVWKTLSVSFCCVLLSKLFYWSF